MKSDFRALQSSTPTKEVSLQHQPPSDPYTFSSFLPDRRSTTSRARSLLVALALGACLASPGSTQEGRARAIGAVVDPYADSGSFSGVVRVERDGRLLFERAYGLANAELGVPNQTSRRFRLHSLTKPFTAAAVLRAVDQERLALSDSICEWLAPCPDSWRKTSIRQLLNHTAGIPDFSALLLSHFSGGTFETYRSIQDELEDLEIPETGAEFR
ncbi:MAG: serine hydrolase domain-containing protein, partial [Thermoanaerobaculia bacterium]|nr:serine hydrolase domain-containing protein [Thermoanaerobaculia bacterium]